MNQVDREQQLEAVEDLLRRANGCDPVILTQHDHSKGRRSAVLRPFSKGGDYVNSSYRPISLVELRQEA